MADLFDPANEAAPSAANSTTATPPTSAPSATTVRRKAVPARAARFSFAGLDRQQLVLVAAAIALLAWGAWVTKTLTARAESQEFVQLELQGIIGEYLQAQARSGNDEATAARQTAVFMAKLDEIVGSYAADGKVVLVHQAIIGGELPDITPEVKQLAYAAAPPPNAPPPAGVEGKMQAFLQGAGGSNGPGR